MFKLYVLILQILALSCLGWSLQPIEIVINDGKGAGIDVDTKPFTKIGNSYYFISEKSYVNWFEAYYQCRLIGGELVAFETKEEWDSIIQYLNERNKRNEFWTSGNDLAKEGMYIWFKNTQAINLDEWAPRQPDNAGGREHCIHIGYIYGDSKVYELNDRPCRDDKNSLFNYICEAQPHTVSVLIWK